MELARETQRGMFPAGASEELKVKLEEQMDLEDKATKYWINRMFTEMDLELCYKSDEDLAFHTILELLCDMDDYLKTSHSLAGYHNVGVAEVMLISQLRKHLGLEKADDLLAYC
jgi:hypothetical protein